MMSTLANTNKKVFLSTTAIEEFWNLSEETIFLGSWCFVNGKSVLDAEELVKFIESPYDKVDLNSIYNYLDNKFEKILPILSHTLNKMHGENYSDNYWRILIGPWLQFYIHTVFDRFSYIEKALNDYPDLTTFLLNEKSYVTPADTKEFLYFIEDDEYNLQVFTRIFRFFGKNFSEKTSKIIHNKDCDKNIKTSLKTRLLHMFEYFIVKIPNLFYNERVYCVNSYLSRLAEIKLTLASYGKIVFISDSYQVNHHDVERNTALRENLTKLDFGNSLFSMCISSMVSLDIPKVFVECYSSTKKKSVSGFPKDPALIVSANAWYAKEVFKFWAASQSERGTPLLGLQHGGADYGARENFIFRDYEVSIVDYYFSWGWKDVECNAEVIPIPSNKLIQESDISLSDLEMDILWVTSTMPRYLTFFPRITSYFERYLDFQMKFINSLDIAYIDNLRIRTHYQDHGWGIRSRLETTTRNIRFDHNDTSYYKSLERCRLCVCDHLSTSATEALALNKPTILFWNSDTNKIRSEYVKYFDLLRSVGILYDSPEDAARIVSKIYNNVNLWWNDNKRKNAVSLFNKVFALRLDNGIGIWKDTMIEIPKK
jgi:putative transferase (TIGR04331 family)